MNQAVDTTMPLPGIGRRHSAAIRAMPPSANVRTVCQPSAPTSDNAECAQARTTSACLPPPWGTERARLTLTPPSPAAHLAWGSLGVQGTGALESDVLAVVAHELRNCLMPIRLAAAQLGNTRKDKLSLPRLRFAIEQQVEHMSRLVGDLLDTSRPGTGTFRLERIQVDMVNVLADALDACRPCMDAREQRLQLDLPAGLPAVEGDPVRLVQVVRNLLENASKYSPRGGEIGVSLAAKLNAMELTVTDHGIGITAAVLPHVFERFVQDPHAVAFNGAGLGIGLSVVREWVQAHGGEVVAHSAGHGLGSRFVVTLPLACRAPTTNG